VWVGNCLVSERTVPQGTEVVVELTHDGTQVSTRASVASVSEGELGLQFVEPSESFLTCVATIIREIGEHQETHDHVRVAATWSHPSEGKLSDFWRSKRNPANLFSLTAEGAALVSPKQPEVGETVVIYLTRANTEYQCQAEVVRQTARGFAVRFVSPDPGFSEVVADLRRTEGRPDPT
jgi:hypothetical protein